MNEVDPVTFGRLLERMDTQDELLEQVLAEMKCMKNDVQELKIQAAHHEERRERHGKYAAYVWSFLAFALGNLIEIWIFRGPGAH